MTENPKRERWNGDYGALPYDTDEFGGGEAARLRYEDFDGNECTVAVEVGEFMPHNSWLSLFDSDGSGDMHIVRRDGVVLLETLPYETVEEVGECIEVRRRRYDHSGREPDDIEDAKDVLREALGDDFEDWE